MEAIRSDLDTGGSLAKYLKAHSVQRFSVEYREACSGRRFTGSWVFRGSSLFPNTIRLSSDTRIKNSRLLINHARFGLRVDHALS
jgi:hypothetical protein